MAVFQSVAQNILPNILPKFTENKPDIHISLIDNTSARIYQRLISGNVDVALSTPPRDIDDNVEFIPLLDDKLGVACHHEHPLAKQDSVTLSDLHKYPFISNGISLFMETPETITLNENATHYVENILSLITALEMNIGVTILGQLSMPKKHNTLRWIPLNDDIQTASRTIGILHIKNDNLSPVLKHFLNTCNTVYPQK